MSKTHTRTNWHEAITCAIQIDLRDYSHLLEYHTEYMLSPNGNRMDMLVIKKQTGFQIPKHIAYIFKVHNIFEMKGFGSTLTADSYYKTNGHAGYYIDLYAGRNSINRNDITLTFPTLHYPKKLFLHLKKDCGKYIENVYPGVYYIINEMYATQVLVISELSPEDSMYLYCLTEKLVDSKIIDALTQDYAINKEKELYTKYMHQFLGSHMKGDNLMVCENLFKLYGTSSKEIAENAKEQQKQIYLPQIEKLTEDVNTLTLENDKLKLLLQQNNIAY